jgi:hypothetical protein
MSDFNPLDRAKIPTHRSSFDQLLCNVNFQVYAVQNLDRNGLPY